MHAGKVAVYWYATAIVLVLSALLRLLSRPMAAPVWLPAAELAAGIGIGALAFWIGRGARPSRLTALVAGPVLVAGAAALYLTDTGYELAVFPAVLGTVVAASSAAAFVRAPESAGAAAGWAGVAPQPRYAPAQGWPQQPPQYTPQQPPQHPPPQYTPQYRPHHAPTVTDPSYAQPAPYQTSREGAEQHLLQARVRRQPRHGASQEPQPPAQSSTPAPEQVTEPIRRPTRPSGDGGLTPDDHPDVELAPRRRRHAKPDPEDPGPANGSPAVP